MRYRSIALICVSAVFQTSQFAAADTSLLAAEFARLEPLSGGAMGVAAVHVETGRAAYLNPREPFPMASAYKVAIAVRLLQRVERGEITLADMVTLEPGHLAPGSGEISRLFDDPGVSLSILNLLELMLLISDNTATDLCLEKAGGGAAVTACMAELGVTGLRVDRSTTQLIADLVGIKELPPHAERSRAKFDELVAALDENNQEDAAYRFEQDPRDTATPAGMAKLLELIWTDKALSPENCARLRDIMMRCETGATRLKGRLPEGTAVAHKTGTIGGSTNDVGVVTLPGNAGHVIVVGFVKDSGHDIPERERAIAEIARAAYDYFLFNRQ